MSEQIFQQLEKVYQTQKNLIDQELNAYDKEIDDACFAREKVDSTRITEIKNNFELDKYILWKQETLLMGNL